MLSLEVHLGVTVSPQTPFSTDFVTLPVSISHRCFASLPPVAEEGHSRHYIHSITGYCIPNMLKRLHPHAFACSVLMSGALLPLTLLEPPSSTSAARSSNCRFRLETPCVVPFCSLGHAFAPVFGLPAEIVKQSAYLSYYPNFRDHFCCRTHTFLLQRVIAKTNRLHVGWQN